MAPPTKCTPELCARLVEHFEAGDWITDACESVGITQETFNQWRKKTRKGDEPVASTFRPVVDALLAAKRKHRLAAVQEFRGNQWLLERRFPAQYAVRVRETLQQELSALMQIAERVLPEEEYAKLLEAVAGAERFEGLM